MLGPGLWWLIAVVAIAVIVIAQSRREKDAEGVNVHYDPNERYPYPDPAEHGEPHTSGVDRNGVDPHRGWTIS